MTKDELNDKLLIVFDIEKSDMKLGTTTFRLSKDENGQSLINYPHSDTLVSLYANYLKIMRN